MELKRLNNFKERQAALKGKVILGEMLIEYIDNRLINRWVNKVDENKRTKESTDKLANELNTLMLHLMDYEKIVNLCGGEGYSYSSEFLAKGSEMTYYLRLEPIENKQNQIIVYRNNTGS